MEVEFELALCRACWSQDLLFTQRISFRAVSCKYVFWCVYVVGFVPMASLLF
jgi:hypothetical protein